MQAKKKEFIFQGGQTDARIDLWLGKRDGDRIIDGEIIKFDELVEKWLKGMSGRGWEVVELGYGELKVPYLIIRLNYPSGLSYGTDLNHACGHIRDELADKTEILPENLCSFKVALWNGENK